MIKAIYLKTLEGPAELVTENIAAIAEQKPKFIWVDLAVQNQDLTNEEISILYDVFKFHELSIEDSLIPQYHPKVEEFENYIFTAIHGLAAKAKNLSDLENCVYEIDMFIGRDFLVTIHTEEHVFLETLFEKAKLKPQVELKSVENLVYNIFQKVVGSYEFTLEKINETVDKIEDKLLGDPSPELMQEIFELKKILLSMRKITEPQKNVYSYFTRETAGLISRKYTAYFRDIFFQYEHINQSIANFNQLIGSILEVYVSGVTLKLNEIIKFLTLIATTFLPALFITSYYGMNVVPFAEHRIFGNDNVWYFAVGSIVLSTIVTYLFMKRKKWF